MSSRYSYVAITPEYADLPIPPSRASIPLGLNPSSSGSRHPEDHEESRPTVEGEGSDSSRIHSWLTAVKDIVQRNAGLLLVVASQAFLTLMNVAVKILNNIDPPITALEVCSFYVLFFFLNW